MPENPKKKSEELKRKSDEILEKWAKMGFGVKEAKDAVL